jgi:hypothetical protein
MKDSIIEELDNIVFMIELTMDEINLNTSPEAQVAKTALLEASMVLNAAMDRLGDRERESSGAI